MLGRRDIFSVKPDLNFFKERIKDKIAFWLNFLSSYLIKTINLRIMDKSVEESSSFENQQSTESEKSIEERIMKLIP